MQTVKYVAVRPDDPRKILPIHRLFFKLNKNKKDLINIFK